MDSTISSARAARRGRPSKAALAAIALQVAADHSPSPRVEVVETYFGADGRPIKRKSLGAARVARSYDRRGNQIEEAYFGADGKPTPRKGLGAARIHWRYDENGNRVEAEFFDAEGALLLRKNAEAEQTPTEEQA